MRVKSRKMARHSPMVVRAMRKQQGSQEVEVGLPADGPSPQPALVSAASSFQEASQPHGEVKAGEV